MITDAVRSVLTAHLDTIQKYTENAEDLTSIQVTILHCIQQDNLTRTQTSDRAYTTRETSSLCEKIVKQARSKRLLARWTISVVTTTNHHFTAIIQINTHTHPFNGPFSGTTRVSRYQKGKTNLDFTEARDSEWQWHQLSHMQVCTLLQTDNHASNPALNNNTDNTDQPALLLLLLLRAFI